MTPPAPTDLDTLAARAARGDAAARATLFGGLRERFLAVAKRRVREEECEDAVQDALGIVLAKYAARPAGTGILPFSFAVLRHVIGNVYQRRTRADLHGELREEVLEGMRGEDPLAGRDWDRARTRVARAIRTLERDHSRCGAIFRGILEGIERGDEPQEVVRAVRERLGERDSSISRGNFYVILHRCRQRLRAALEMTESEEAK